MIVVGRPPPPPGGAPPRGPPPPPPRVSPTCPKTPCLIASTIRLQALQKNPAVRPSAQQLLDHPWVRANTREKSPPRAAELSIPSYQVSKPDIRYRSMQ